MPRVGNPKQRRKTFFREWREHRGLTQEQLADRMETTKANISRVESGKQGYTQDYLEALAIALQTDEASLLMRDPSEPEGIWSIWENALPGQRRQIVEHSKIIIRRRTS